MKAAFFLPIGLSLIAMSFSGCKNSSGTSGNQDANLWSLHQDECPAPASMPQRFVCLDLDTARLFDIITDTAIKQIELPNADGKTEEFSFTRSGTVSPELLRKYPNLQTFKGVKVNDPTTTVRFEYTDAGFTAMISGQNMVQILEPVKNRNNVIYSYLKSEVMKEIKFIEPPKN